MRGHVRKHGKGYQGVIYLGRGADGKKRYRYLPTVPDEKRAHTMVADVIRDLYQGTYVEPSKLTFGEYLDMWLREKVEPFLRPSTYRRYKGIVETHIKPALGHIPLQKLSPLDLQRHYAAALQSGQKAKCYGKEEGDPLSVATVRNHHRTIHAALEQAVKWQLVARNVADAVEPPRMARKPEVRALSVEQAHKLIDVAYRESNHPEVYVLALTTGMRQGEILGLRWQDIDPPVAHVCQTLRKAGPRPEFAPPKTRRGERTIWLLPQAVECLEKVKVRQQAEKAMAGARYEDYDLVCCQPNGRPLDGHNLSERDFKRLLAIAGLPRIRFHDLRHTAATLMLDAGIPLKVVSEILGHSVISVTVDIYGHVLLDMLQEAAEKYEDYLFGQREK